MGNCLPPRKRNPNTQEKVHSMTYSNTSDACCNSSSPVLSNQKENLTPIMLTTNSKLHSPTSTAEHNSQSPKK